jgi:hypothetical protein
MRRAGRCLGGQRIAFATLAKGLYDDSFEDSTGCLSWAIRRSIYLEAGFRQRRPLVEDAQSVGYVVGISFGQPRFGYGPGQISSTTSHCMSWVCLSIFCTLSGLPRCKTGECVLSASESPLESIA